MLCAMVKKVYLTYCLLAEGLQRHTKQPQLVKCTGNPWVLLEVPVPVPAWGVQVFAGVHIVRPWGYPDLYPPAGTHGFCGNAGLVQNQSKPSSNSKLDWKFGLGSATPWNQTAGPVCCGIAEPQFKPLEWCAALHFKSLAGQVFGPANKSRPRKASQVESVGPMSKSGTRKA